MIEIMRRYRIITVEDTLELPARAMLQLGFNIQQIKRLLLRNCVNPKHGLHIFNCAFKEVQETL